MSAEFQLVIQFDAATPADFDDLVALETGLIDALGPSGTVDGHDFGCGEFNIFIYTEEPESTFQAARKIFEADGFVREMRAAYREVEKEEYVPIWPPSLIHFEVR